MTSSYKTLLITSCISFSLTAMEEKSITTNSTNNTDSSSAHFYAKNDIYKKTYGVLSNYDPANHESINAIVDIVSAIKKLNAERISTKEIGQFAYQQENSSISSKFFSAKPPHNSPLYITVFFERVNQYNNTIVKNNFRSPTLNEFKYYLENKESKEIVDIAETLGIYCDLSTMLHHIPSNWAIDEFERLLQDIVKIRNSSPEIIQALARRLYDFKAKKEQ